VFIYQYLKTLTDGHVLLSEAVVHRELELLVAIPLPRIALEIIHSSWDVWIAVEGIQTIIFMIEGHVFFILIVL
jgi:hypothetical protein